MEIITMPMIILALFMGLFARASLKNLGLPRCVIFFPIGIVILVHLMMREMPSIAEIKEAVAVVMIMLLVLYFPLPRWSTKQ